GRREAWAWFRTRQTGTAAEPREGSGDARECRCAGVSRGLRRGRAGSGGQRRDALGDGRLAVRRLVLVDDALAHGLVELARRDTQQGRGRRGVTGSARPLELPDDRLQRRLDRLVAQPGLLVLPVALDLGLDVRHATALSFGCFWSDDVSSGGLRSEEH